MRKRLWQLLAACMVVGLFAPLVQLESASADGDSFTVNRFSFPSSLGDNLVSGPQHKLWYTTIISGHGSIPAKAQVCSATTAGVPDESSPCIVLPNNAYPGISGYVGAAQMVYGPDGKMWFIGGIGYGHRLVGSIDVSSGTVNEYPFTDSNQLNDLVVGPDGNMWFTYGAGIGRITTAGVITEFPLSATNAASQSIASGSDGNLWFTESIFNASDSTYSGKIVRLTTDGQMTEYPIIAGSYDGLPPLGSITSGPDGNLWFTEQSSDADGNLTGSIGRITTAGSVTQFTLPGALYTGMGIVSGPDGNVWFTEVNNWVVNDGLDTYAGKVGRITPQGTITEYSVTDGYLPRNRIIVGPDNNIWTSEYYAYSGGQPTHLDQIVLPGSPQNLTAPSPTNRAPILSWNAVDGASSYNIYRDGAAVGSSTSTTYTDSAATEGTHTYYVRAVISGSESAGSNSIDVVYDKTRPTVAFDEPTDFSQPFSVGPTVTVSASDDASGLAILVIHVYTSSGQLLTTCGTATPDELAAGTMSCDLSSLAPGTYSIRAGANDKAGNNRTVLSGNFTITGE